MKTPESMRDIGGVLNTYDRRLGLLERRGRGFSIPVVAGVTVIAADEPPAGPQVTGTLWIDTDDGSKIYRWNGSGWVSTLDPSVDLTRNRVSVAIASWQDTAATGDGLVTLYRQATAPSSGLNVGDLWVDTDDNALYRWNGSAWADQSDTDLGDLLDLQPMASTIADGEVKTFWQFTAPTPDGFGDIWVKTSDDPPTMWRWNNFDWIQVLDWSIALQQDQLDGKISTYYVSSAPTATATGDLWYDTDDGNHPYRWDGGTWVDIQDGSIATASTAAASALSAATAAMSAAVAAQATADGAIRTYYVSTPPWANGTGGHSLDAGDMWFDIDDGQAYRWNDSTLTWEIIEDNSIAAALAAAVNAQTTADGKITAYYQTTPPATGELGDLWYDTDDGNKPYYCSSIGPIVWTPVQDQVAIDGTVGQWENTNPLLDWPAGVGSYPTGWASFAGTPTRETTIKKTGTSATRFTVTAATNSGMAANFTMPAYQYITVEVDVYLVSGDFSGAGIYLTWNGSTPVSNYYQFSDLEPAPVTGKWYRFVKVLKQPAGLVAPTNILSAYFLAGFTGSGWTVTAKTIIIDKYGIRKSTTEEITAYNAPSNLSTGLATKSTSYYQTTEPTGGTYLQGDLWFDTDDGNHPYVWDGTDWIDARDNTLYLALNNTTGLSDSLNQTRQDLSGTISSAQNAADTADGRISTSDYVPGNDDLIYEGSSGALTERVDGSLWLTRTRDRRNYVTNPSIEVDASGWTAEGTGTTITRVAVTPFIDGAWGLQVTNGSSGTAWGAGWKGGSPYKAAVPGEAWVGSVFVQAVSGTNTDMYAEIAFYDSSSVRLGIATVTNREAAIYNDTTLLATLTVTAPHYCVPGGYIRVAGVATDFNGTFRVTEITDTTVSYLATVASPATEVAITASSGTITPFVGVLTEAPTDPPVVEDDDPWIVVTATGIAPPTTAYIYGVKVVHPHASAVWILDGALLERHHDLGRYFDGGSEDARWDTDGAAGVPDNSESVLTGGRINALFELDDSDWVPKQWSDETISDVDAEKITGGAGYVRPALEAHTLDGQLIADRTIPPDKLLVPNVIASEALTQGDIVNVWDNSGVFMVRKADSDAGYPADGFVNETVALGVFVAVQFHGYNPWLTGLSPGTQFLSVTAGKVSSSSPNTVGCIVQSVGFAPNATTLNFVRSLPILLT